MIAHVLRFSFKDGTSEEDFAAAMEAFRRTARAATVSFAVVGPYAGNPADGYTHSAIFGLADLETMERFMYEPAHREADFIVHPHMAKFDGFDVSDEYDPDLEAKMMDIQRRRIASDPELAALLGIEHPALLLPVRESGIDRKRDTGDVAGIVGDEPGDRIRHVEGFDH